MLMEGAGPNAGWTERSAQKAGQAHFCKSGPDPAEEALTSMVTTGTDTWRCSRDQNLPLLIICGLCKGHQVPCLETQRLGHLDSLLVTLGFFCC